MPMKTKAKPRERSRRRAPSAAYWEWLRRFPLRPLESETDLDQAIAILDELIDQPRLDAWEEHYMDLLGDVVHAYEQKQHPIEPLSDAEMLQQLCEEKGVTQQQVAEATAIVNSTLSAVVHGKRRFTRDHIRRLADFFQVDSGLFRS